VLKLIHFEIITTLILFAGVATAIKTTSANPFTIGIVRLVIAVLGIGIINLNKNKLEKIRSLTSSDLKFLISIGLCFSVHWLSYFFSVKLAGSALAVLTISCYGVFLSLWGMFIYGEPLTKINILGLVLSTLGVYLLVPNFDLTSLSTLGVLIGLASAFIYSIVPILHKKVLHIDSSIRILGQFSFALLFFMISFPWANFDLVVNDWGGLLYLGIFGTLIAHSLWAKITSQIPAHTSSVIYYLYIPLSVAIAQWHLGEKLSISSKIGGFLIVLGACASYLFSLMKKIKV
jgi:drug/metabolite transporter (DMT)-like permease